MPVSAMTDASWFESNASTTDSTRLLMVEPTIRVGLYAPKSAVAVRSDFEYRVFSGQTEQGVLFPGVLAEVSYADGMYVYSSSEFEFISAEPIRLLSDDPEAFFTLPQYQRRLAGRKTNFNNYRGTFELRYAPKSKSAYVINELPLDAYVAGVAETSNDAPVEYNRALAVAIRSYAYFKRAYARLSPKNIFDVVPTTVDQLYLGYAAEIASPQVVQAAVDTYGQMVTYRGEPVVTPYFSRSDGQTRGWKQVWGGTDKPWLVSVAAIYDKGKKKLGHGVGMSGSDALRRAGNDGWKYHEILKHYYSGTEVERIY